MSDNLIDKEKRFVSTVLMSLEARTGTPSSEDVEILVKELAKVVGFDGDLASIADQVFIARETRMDPGTSIVEVDAEHDRDWFKRDGIDWFYSNAHEKFLEREGWHHSVIQSLSDVGMRVLGLLQDPSSEGRWDRRGLVIGHVQSGKTANYLSLIAKAADSGYKFIIVIAGLHNNLRKQTQERIDEGFVGRSSDPNNVSRIGVAELDPAFPHPVTLTTINDDFNKQTADQSGFSINNFNNPVIVVIKKNVNTLKALHRWLAQMNTKGQERISDVPMMMIDDEADNASINYSQDDLDPTLTNQLIRKILGLFEKKCYIGYTATPFANIFINPNEDDLFPRDFIYCLDAPNTYFGPERLFLNDTVDEQIVRLIADGESYIPHSLKKNADVKELPESLYFAIRLFIIARAVRNLRGNANKHFSMMINVSRFVNIQSQVRNFVSSYTSRMKNAVAANYCQPDERARENSYMRALEDAFVEEYLKCGFGWKEVKSELLNAFENLDIIVVNSKSDQALDYKRHQLANNGLTALAIGGLSLSRGLTIEGLCISYMYRNTRTYDTLMQMGRWFGYRQGFEDLCRVFLSEESSDWYSHIAEASEELRQQIKRMSRNDMSPMQFGLYVKRHPDSLLITAANKMSSAEKITREQNYSGKIVESHLLPEDDSINKDNEKLIAEFWKRKFNVSQRPTNKGWFFKDVAVSDIVDFLNRFQTHPFYTTHKDSAVEYLLKLETRYPKGDVLLISIGENDEYETAHRLGFQDRKCHHRMGGCWQLNKHRVASRGDEKFGLSDQQEKDARLESESTLVSDIYYRKARNKPLLMIHRLRINKQDENIVPAFGISFPPGDDDTTVEVVANKVYLDLMLGPPDIVSPEDYDYED